MSVYSLCAIATVLSGMSYRRVSDVAGCICTGKTECFSMYQLPILSWRRAGHGDAQLAALVAAAAGQMAGLRLGRHFSVRDVIKWCRRMQVPQHCCPCSKAAAQALVASRPLHHVPLDIYSKCHRDTNRATDVTEK